MKFIYTWMFIARWRLLLLWPFAGKYWRVIFFRILNELWLLCEKDADDYLFENVVDPCSRQPWVLFMLNYLESKILFKFKIYFELQLVYYHAALILIFQTNKEKIKTNIKIIMWLYFGRKLKHSKSSFFAKTYCKTFIDLTPTPLKFNKISTFWKI